MTRTPIITTKPSEDHTYSAGNGAGAGAGKLAVNVGQTVNDPIIQFNGKSLSPTNQVKIKFDSNTLNDHNTEMIIDNRHSDGTSSDAAYESSEER